MNKNRPHRQEEPRVFTGANGTGTAHPALLAKAGDHHKFHLSLSDSLQKAFRTGRITELGHVTELLVQEVLLAKSEYGRVVFTIGVLTSDGMDKKSENWALLDLYTRALNRHPIIIDHGMPAAVFSTTSFPDELEGALSKHTQEEFVKHWQAVVSHVTEVAATPRWPKSHGAIDEVRTANSLNITVHNLDEDPALREFLHSIKRQ